MKHRTPANYATKFADFIRLCESAKVQGTDSVIVAAPWVIGDTYDEIIESLCRLAEADLALRIADADRGNERSNGARHDGRS